MNLEKDLGWEVQLTIPLLPGLQRSILWPRIVEGSKVEAIKNLLHHVLQALIRVMVSYVVAIYGE